jgi:aspartate/methionine/tyrosine aminotransferase
MFSRRLPGDFGHNEWFRTLEELRAKGGALLDLTQTNPLRAGLGGPGGVEALVQAARDRGTGYEPDPKGSRVAREAVAREFAPPGAAIDPADVVLAASTSEAYAHIFRLLADPGDNILVPSPSYPLVPPIAALESVEVRHYRLVYEGRWRIDLDALAQQIDARTKAIVVVQPNNPTGSSATAEERAALIDLAARNDVAILSDEVFVEFPRPGGEGSLRSFLAEEERALCFVMNGISKCCGLPQMKLAWIVVRGPEEKRAKAIVGLEWIGDLFLSVSTPAQEALPQWLAGRGEFQRQVQTRIAHNLDAIRAMALRRPEISLLEADGGWSAVLRLPEVRSDEEWALELLRRGVAMHPGHFYDFAAGAHLVVSLLPREEEFTRGMEILQKMSGAAITDRAP